ncbi:MAG: hypothetical protein WC516_01225 [Patescibacteria group bacterium]
MNAQEIIAQLLTLTSPELTKEEAVLLEGAPKGNILNSESVIIVMIKKRRRDKASQLLHQLLGL